MGVLAGTDQVLAELGAALKAVDTAAVEAACGSIAGARRVMLYGCGREGLMMRALAMRLHHLGLDVSMQGDMTAPPLGRGDLFLCSAGPGGLSTVSALIGVAQAAGARVLMLTAEPAREAPQRADQLLVLPGQTMARGAGTALLPMGSVYEGAMFVLFELMVRRLAEITGRTPASMEARHTNME